MARVFVDAPDVTPNPWAAGETRYLMSGHSTLLDAADFALVEEGDKIVAATCLIGQTWEYDGIAFDVGRPELVASDPDYRNRGLIRALFDAIHERSAARGQVAQGITGIPYFYRQFGYEYALDLDGGRVAYLNTIPDRADGEPEPYTLRDATADDLPLIRALYDQRRAGLLVSAAIPEAFWRSTLTAPRDEFNVRWCLHVLLDASGAPCGYVRRTSKRWGKDLPVFDVAVRDGVPLRAAGLAALRALCAIGAALPSGPDPARQEPLAGIYLSLGRAHPLYDVLGDSVAPKYDQPYAWYVRVPDLPGFLRLLAPALERRLAASALAGHSGELLLDFYRGGLRLAFAAGRLAEVAPWTRPLTGGQHAGFPPLVFLQLLFGRRSFAELDEHYPDVIAWNPEARALLETLFPKRLSRVMWYE
jgi:GNAT superfamily N-acetyltransferase